MSIEFWESLGDCRASEFGNEEEEGQRGLGFTAVKLMSLGVWGGRLGSLRQKGVPFCSEAAPEFLIWARSRKTAKTVSGALSQTLSITADSLGKIGWR